MVIHHFYGSDDMLVLITYDVSTQTQAGVGRLRKVAKVCENYGQRVQNSVFECLLDSAQLKFVKAKLLDIMDKKEELHNEFILWRKTRKNLPYCCTI